MKKRLRFELSLMLFVLMVFLVEACSNVNATKPKAIANSNTIDNKNSTNPSQPLSKEFKDFWYAGDAEITSYTLQQARYGELREGTAVLIYVTEPFLPEVQVKADGSNPTNVPVLKLNATKNYLTGIYPYSIMSSTFYPVADNQNSIKTSLSVQEWCGHVYSQLNNRKNFEFTSHSYFEGEADQNFTLDKALLENEIWTKIRINPDNLPTGAISIIPSLEFFRNIHQQVQAFEAEASLEQKGDMGTYTLAYKNGMRKLSINFNMAFPYTIQSWSEEFKSGFGVNATLLTSTGTKIKSLKTPYWRQNSNKFIGLRDSLGL